MTYAKKALIQESTILFTVLSLFLAVSNVSSAYAGNPTVQGFNADVIQVYVSPATVDPGQFPTIKGYVHNTSSSDSGYGGAATLDIKVVIQYPGGGSYTGWWDNSSFNADQTKYFTKSDNYDTSQPGTYTVTYYAYNIDRTHLFSHKSNTFTVVSQEDLSLVTSGCYVDPSSQNPGGRITVYYRVYNPIPSVLNLAWAALSGHPGGAHGLMIHPMTRTKPSAIAKPQHFPDILTFLNLPSLGFIHSRLCNQGGSRQLLGGQL